MIRVNLFCVVFFLLRPSVAHLQGRTNRDSAPETKDVLQQCSGCHSIDTDEKKVGRRSGVCSKGQSCAMGNRRMKPTSAL
jgi:hypothetical protein